MQISLALPLTKNLLEYKTYYWIVWLPRALLFTPSQLSLIRQYTLDVSAFTSLTHASGMCTKWDHFKLLTAG